MRKCHPTWFTRTLIITKLGLKYERYYWMKLDISIVQQFVIFYGPRPITITNFCIFYLLHFFQGKWYQSIIQTVWLIIRHSLIENTSSCSEIHCKTSWIWNGHWDLWTWSLRITLMGHLPRTSHCIYSLVRVRLVLTWMIDYYSRLNSQLVT